MQPFIFKRQLPGLKTQLFFSTGQLFFFGGQLFLVVLHTTAVAGHTTVVGWHTAVVIRHTPRVVGHTPTVIGHTSAVAGHLTGVVFFPFLHQFRRLNRLFRMNPPTNQPGKPVIAPLPDLKRLAKALAHVSRWKMLRELTCGESRTIAELASVADCGYENTRSHLAMLRQAGMVIQTRGRLYQLPKHHLPTPGEPVVDFGHCLLRLDAGK